MNVECDTKHNGIEAAGSSETMVSTYSLHNITLQRTVTFATLP